jgi:Pvc16 N-terminal domain
VSNALALAGVTAVLRDLLNDELVNSNVAGVLGQSVTVTTLPPDRVIPENGTEASQLNVFLRHVTPNTGWRNEGLPSRDGAGRSRLSNPPLALDLHYLISAYGAEPLHAEILLGYAMQLLHENPAIPRDAVRNALEQEADPNLILPPALQSLAAAGLADQVEQLRVTPEYLSNEDLSKFWTATLAHYRPCAAYQVSVALIQKELPRPLPLPVLVRNIAASPSVLPTRPAIAAVVPAAKQPVAQLGLPVTLEGFHLAGTAREVLLFNDKFDIQHVLPGAGNSHTKMSFTIPTTDAGDVPVGVYRVSVRLQANGDDKVRETNQLALTVAPSIDGLPMTVPRSGGTASFSISFTPALRAGQSARLVLGGNEYAPQPFSGTSTTTLSFEIPDAPVDDFPARLRIDGIDSPVIDVEAQPPVFNKRIRIQ